MRRLFPIVLLAVLLAGCTAYIPVKDGFGTSALRRAGKTPPEYAAFNNYDPRVNALLAEQVCATPYVLLEQKTHPAVPGELITWRGPCQPFVLTPYTLAEYLLPARPLLAWQAPVAPRPPAPVPPPPVAVPPVAPPPPPVPLWRRPPG
ncbi:MAG: hypothetical protein ACREFK_18450 [Stellaceae bacterium]